MLVFVMTTTTTTTTMASTRGVLDLNHLPPPDYEDHVKEELKRAMIQHEILFKHQVLVSPFLCFHESLLALFLVS